MSQPHPHQHSDEPQAAMVIMPRRPPRRHSEDFKAAVVQAVRKRDKQAKSIANEHNIAISQLYRWVHQADARDGVESLRPVNSKIRVSIGQQEQARKLALLQQECSDLRRRLELAADLEKENQELRNRIGPLESELVRLQPETHKLEAQRDCFKQMFYDLLEKISPSPEERH